MKKILACMTVLFLLLTLGNVTVFADPGEPIGTGSVKYDPVDVNVHPNERSLDPGEPIGT